MFGIGLFELILIFLVVLLVFGPQKFPEIVRNIGKFFKEVGNNMYRMEDIINSQPPEDVKKEVKEKIFNKKKDTK